MKNEYTVHIVIKKYLFVYLIKAWTIDKNNTSELHFKKYCMKHQIDKVEISTFSFPSFSSGIIVIVPVDVSGLPGFSVPSV